MTELPGYDNCADRQPSEVFQRVIEDLKARDALGWKTYGREMKPHDGRDSLQDAYEEVLDQAVYLKKAILERVNQEAVVRFCAEEVYRQGRGPIQVWWMYDAWMAAIEYAACPDGRFIQASDLIDLGHRIEREKNSVGVWRNLRVRVGERTCPDPKDVPGLMHALIQRFESITPEEAYKQFQEIHPLVDGNGRLGKILYNWLRGSLGDPAMPPNFFSCSNP